MLFLYNYFSILIILALDSIVVYGRNPTIEFIPNFKSQIIINAKIGTPSQEFKLLLDTSSIFLWVFNKNATSLISKQKKRFDISKSSTYIPIKYNLDPLTTKGNFSGTFAKDTIILGDEIKIDNFSIFLVEKSIDKIEDLEDVDGVLGLGFNYEDHPNLPQFSLLEEMYSKELIDIKMFNIKFKNEYRGKLTFGKLINEEITDLYNGTCQTFKIEEETEVAKWKCTTTRIELGNIDKNETDVYTSTSNLIFDTSIDYLIVPSDFFVNKIEKYLLKEQIQKGICKTTEIKKGDNFYLAITCNSSLEYGLIPNIYFVFDTYAMVYSPIDMFYLNDEVYTLKIFSQYGNTKKWIIGQSVLKNFYMIFDKLNEVVQFSSRDFLINLNEKTFGVFIFVLIVGCVIIVLMVGGYSLFNFLSKKFDFGIEDKNYHSPTENEEEKNPIHNVSSFSVSKDSLIPKIDMSETEKEVEEYELQKEEHFN